MCILFDKIPFYQYLLSILNDPELREEIKQKYDTTFATHMIASFF